MKSSLLPLLIFIESPIPGIPENRKHNNTFNPDALTRAG